MSRPSKLLLVDRSLPTPAENLALDEALLLDCERSLSASDSSGSEPVREYLRFWESPSVFVVLGVAGRLEKEVDRAACRARGVPILRRASGGGTVLQGPGCLNFALVLAFAERPELARIDSSYAAILGRTASALPGAEVRPQGTSDLAIDERKISGSAQKRTRSTLLHHGTILYAFDLENVDQLLREPEKQPQYRRRRRHLEFIRNLHLPAAAIKENIARAWGAQSMPREALPEIGKLAREKYDNPAWTARF